MLNKKPKISILVIGYRMAQQLANTLYTLSCHYQRGVQESDYEVVFVENSSCDNFQETQLANLGGNFRFFRREESSSSPIAAVNFGFSKCRGDIIGLMIDGARMVTPQVVVNVLRAAHISANALTIVPGYQLGPKPQNESSLEGYDEAEERKLLESVDWKADGYELFSISSISGANPNGYLAPIMECNCVFAPASNFRRIGYADERFQMRGGGAINLHIYRRLGLVPGSVPVVLPGEGSFHQYHGGVTTSSLQREEVTDMHAYGEQLQGIWRGKFRYLSREPLVVGSVSRQAQKFLSYSVACAERRGLRLRMQGIPAWEDDELLNNNLQDSELPI